MSAKVRKPPVTLIGTRATPWIDLAYSRSRASRSRVPSRISVAACGSKNSSCS
jgi:hypothetical protein